MTDASVLTTDHGHQEAVVQKAANQVQAETQDARPHRPARPDEVTMIHARLMEAITTSEHYSDEFKLYEAARLTSGYLRNLISIDPRHVLVLLAEGRPVGIMVTGPELGTLWLYWTYVFPECRTHAQPMRFLPALVRVWDNDRFHKIATYIRPNNKVAIAMSRRARFSHTVTHEKHLFGEDFMLWEHPLTRANVPYDLGAGMGFVARLKNRVLALFGR